MVKPNPPCKGCQERRVGCHGGCFKYLGWQIAYGDAKDKAKKLADADRIIQWYDNDMREACLKRWKKSRR